MARDEHWNRVHGKLKPGETSWHQTHLALSLKLIEQLNLPRSAAIVDVGAGSSTLVDDLLARGFSDLTVLDCSSTALDVTRSRLLDQGTQIDWLVADVTATDLPRSRFDLWHDRAVFHFLTKPSDRAAYRRSLERALRPDGHLIVATFAPTAPERCSGLPVVRYDADSLQREFAPAFRLVATHEEAHRTPSGKLQEFIYCHFKTGARA